MSVIRSPDDQPLALLVSEAPQSVVEFGRHLTGTLLGGLALLLLAFGGALAWLLIRLYRTQQSRHVAEARYRKVADQLTETILLVDSQTLGIAEINRAALGAMGYSDDDIGAMTALDIFPDLSRETLLLDTDNGRRVCQSRLRRKDGTELDTEVTISEFRDDDRRLLCLVGHDVSHRRAAEEQHKANQRKLLHMAQHDPLTGLPNRLYLRSRFPRVIRHAQDAQRCIALIYVDVDHFKSINDSLGHGHGDRLLQIIAQRLRNTVGAQDAVVRMGGDEFVIVATLLPEVASIDNLAQRIQASVCAPIVVDDTPLAVTASMGISVYPRDGLDLDLLLKHADIALYQAKEAGRHGHRFFDADMDLRVSEDLALEQALRHALGSNQFYLDFQPVVDLRTNRVSSVEALLRWHHPELGQIPPARFVPIAERTGLIEQLGQFALENVLHQMRAWLDVGVACVPVAINVAPRQLARNDFAELVKRLTSEVGIEPRWLRFEITESALLQNVQELVGTLTQLREIGSQILIDDFGTGYSGLSYLTTLPVDTVKIDRSFVTSMMKGEKDEMVISSIIDMAAKLKLVTIAEGIETREQALRLRRLGCNFAQGYFFSRPLSARRCRRLLQKMHALAAPAGNAPAAALQSSPAESEERQAAAG
jgi:diguanylate cyclase (GGDEF)-like protein/PAS domain S-box-containing protein